MALYADRGFDSTTVAEIASQAGVTERTFFRHFADKREVLFGGSTAFQDLIVSTVAVAPASLGPIDAAAAGLVAAGAQLQERRAFARQRHAIIASSAELRERELNKFASLSLALAETLRRRGLDDAAASVAAQVAIALFRTSFERWITDEEQRDLPALIRESLDQLKLLAAAG